MRRTMMALSLAVACGGGTDDDGGDGTGDGTDFATEVPDQPLQGTINDESWAFVSGIVVDEGGQPTALLAPAALGCTDAPDPFSGYVEFPMPDGVGSWTFFDDGNPQVSVQFGSGTSLGPAEILAIDRYDDDTVEGGLVFEAPGTELAGSFTLTNCL